MSIIVDALRTIPHTTFRDALTNHKFGSFGSLTAYTVADNTAVASFIWLLHIGDGECWTVCSWKPLLVTHLPPSNPASSFMLPLVVQRLCSSGLDSEWQRFAWDSILQTFGMMRYLWRLICSYVKVWIIMSVCIEKKILLFATTLPRCLWSCTPIFFLASTSWTAASFSKSACCFWVSASCNEKVDYHRLTCQLYHIEMILSCLKQSEVLKAATTTSLH